MAEVLVALWNDAGKRGELVRRGSERVKQFDIAQTVGAHRQAFERARLDFAEHGPVPYSPAWDLLRSGWRAIRANPHD
jgi:hypothetical protein